ncbi:cytochrome P450 [Streptosporangium sp. NBC_01639]|uniref:cytochrome P450 n=1 Tax=Streptosporangium sp. NBC_01639 TaxID=2975948 RepID=UPI003869B2C3|nr:cytochrome P450 [Streptosporangium sp. NBC_01639]
MTEITTDLPGFPMPRTCPPAPPPEYAQLRADGPVSEVVLPDGRATWVITGYHLVREFLTDPRASKDSSHPGYPSPAPGFREATRGLAKGFVFQDPPEHTRHRRMVAGEFAVKPVKRMRANIQRIVDERIEALLVGDRPVDLVRALSLPVPSLVICELLGVPYSDRDFFHTRTAVAVSRSTAPQERVSVLTELREYLAELVEAKEGEPGDDLISRLIAKYRQAGEYDRERIVVTATMLLVAGHETTANMISLGTVALLENPDRLAELQADPAVVPRAVEELLRYFSIADVGTARVATADIELGDVVIREGDGVIALGAAANHDPAVFERPGDLDFHRGGGPHLAFGYGIHQCLGQNLARLELEIVFSTLFSRIPGLRLVTAASELPYKDEANIYGVHEVPVTW